EIERFARRLEAAGATVSSLTLDPALEALVGVTAETAASEARLSLAPEPRVHAARLCERLRHRLAGPEPPHFTRRPEQLRRYDARLSLAHEYRVHADRLSERLRQRLAGSEATDFTRYQELLRRAAEGRRGVAALFDAVDVLLYPAAEGEAEPGIGYSGSPRFG